MWRTDGRYYYIASPLSWEGGDNKKFHNIWHWKFISWLGTFHSSLIWLSFLHFGVSSFLPSLHIQCSCYYTSQIDADMYWVFWLDILHPSWMKNMMHFYCIQVCSRFFSFQSLVWYVQIIKTWMQSLYNRPFYNCNV